MTHEQITYNAIQPLRNVAALAQLIERLDGRPAGLPGIGVFYGPSGYGKTVACIQASINQSAVHVRMGSTWAAKKLCERILFELGVHQKRNIADMVDQIIECLGRTNRPLLIDEADFMVKKQMIEVVRDIQDGCEAPLILIGEEKLPQNLQRWERVHNRVLEWTQAQPGDLHDLKMLARFYAPDIDIADDLKGQLLRETRGTVRRISTSLAALNEFAMARGLEAVSLDDWGNRSFFTGEAPAPRRQA